MFTQPMSSTNQVLIKLPPRWCQSAIKLLLWLPHDIKKDWSNLLCCVLIKIGTQNKSAVQSIGFDIDFKYGRINEGEGEGHTCLYYTHVFQ